MSGLQQHINMNVCGADDDFPLSQLSAQHSGSSSVLGLLTYDEKMRVVAIIDITYVILSF